MNRYFLIRRLRGPVILLLIGAVALLHSTGVIQSFGRWFWPLLFIMLGLLLLAERMALASEDGDGLWPNGGAPNQGAYDPRNYPGPGAGVPPYPWQSVQPAGQQPAEPSTSIVPVGPHDLTKEPNGGQS